MATLRDNTDSDSVTAIGHEAGLNCIHGNDNTFIGAGSGLDNSANSWNNSTAIGTQSKISDSNQITLGRSSDYVHSVKTKMPPQVPSSPRPSKI